ncbi:MAG: hypothetical protein LBQ58_07285 [Synergistaceae bacterium]|jgi:exopolyphosphatase/guanosine-5'-triphosphate,3'-diphosphate pyrophosphatase|nr:hypothetical protein [Synergistaceae bacterium]
MSTKAVIDVGTNSIKLLVADDSSGGPLVRFDGSVVARLGEGVGELGLLGDAAMSRALDVIADMADRARSMGADEIMAVGTQAMRRAKNSADFIRMVESRCGVYIRVIDGDEEAYLSFRAAIASLPHEEGDVSPICLFDVGGGSSEIVRGDGKSVLFRRSVPVGALSLRDKFFITNKERQLSGEANVNEDILGVAADYIRSLLELECGGEFGKTPGRGGLCVGVGGTITTMAAVRLGLEGENYGLQCGVFLDMREVERQIALYSSSDESSRGMIKGLPPERADIILPGACIIKALMRFCGFDKLAVSSHGLRHGVMDTIIRASRYD